MDTSAADTPAKPIAKAAKDTPAKAAKDTPAKAAKDTPAKAEKVEKEAGHVKPEKVEKEEPVIEAKDAGPVKPEEAKKEEPAKEVNDKENETTNKPAEENTELTKSAKKKKKKKEGKEEDSPVKPVAETKTEEAVETKTPKKEATEAKKTPAKTPKRTLKGGIQLEDLKVGNGPEATGKKMIGMYYEGKLKSNNKVFDSCLRGKPFKFRLGAGEVIKGWDVGIEGMKVGGKRRLSIPPAMAYGAKGAPPDIPANSHLVFEVET